MLKALNQSMEKFALEIYQKTWSITAMGEKIDRKRNNKPNLFTDL